jgi:ankyrin repeat protein
MRVKLLSALSFCIIVFFPVLGYTNGTISLAAGEIDTSYFMHSDNDYNLAMAATKGNIEVVKLLIDRGANVNAILEDGITPLINAARAGHVNICALLIEKGADVDIKPASGQTALSTSAKYGKLKTAEFLIKKGATVDARDFFGRTPLMYAAAFNDTAMCILLISHNADKSIVDNDGVNALLAACINNRIETTRVLLEKGMSPDAKDLNGVTPLMVASGNGNFALAELLLKYNANINIKTSSGETALTIAVLKSNERMVNMLIEHKADVNQKMNAAETPLTIARFYKVDKSVVDLLVLSDAKENHLPDFRMFTIGPEFNFNLTDYMNGLSLGVKEIKYHIDVNAGFQFRVVPNRILNEHNNESYQFWEKRSIVYLGLNKNFNIFKTKKANTNGLSIGVKEAYTYGAYKGTDISATKTFIFIPEIGIYQIVKGFQLGLNYNYVDLKTTNINPHRITFSIKVIFGSFNSFDPVVYKNWEL